MSPGSAVKSGIMPVGAAVDVLVLDRRIHQAQRRNPALVARLHRGFQIIIDFGSEGSWEFILVWKTR